MATRWLTLAHLHDPVRAACAATGRGLDHDAFARQMVGERLLHRLAPLECRDLRRLLRGLFGPGRILSCIGHQLLELQFQLVEEPGGALRAAAVLGAPEQRDLELERRDHRLGGRHDRAGFREFSLSRRRAPLGQGQRSTQFLEFRGSLGHGRKLTHRLGNAHGKPALGADLSNLCRSLRPARVAPIDALEKIAKLRRGDWHRLSGAACRPDEFPRFETIQIQRHADPVVP